MSPANTNNWASVPLGDDPRDALQAFQQGLTVSLISTDRAKLLTCDVDEPIATVLTTNRECDYDFLPVIKRKERDLSAETIVGLLNLSTLRQTKLDGSVRDHMQPLSEDHLIGANSHIVTFIRDADSRRCRLVVSNSQIVGLVSLSDLQRLPVRVVLFGLVTGLEINMANLIRRRCLNDDWMDRLTEQRRLKIKTEIRVSKHDDTWVDSLLFTQFADKRTIITHYEPFASNQKNFEDELKQIELLRNHLAHANDYAPTPEAAVQICAIVRLIDKWNEEFLRDRSATFATVSR